MQVKTITNEAKEVERCKVDVQSDRNQDILYVVWGYKRVPKGPELIEERYTLLTTRSPTEALALEAVINRTLLEERAAYIMKRIV